MRRGQPKTSTAGDPREGLLAREAERDAIGRLVGSVTSGGGGALGFAGTAGIGKSRLLAVARRAAEDAGVAALSARGSELEAGFAFGVVRQLFEAPLARLPAAERDELFDGAAALAGGLLGAPPEALPASDTPFAALHGLYWLTANMSERRPIVLCVDDLHWVDQPSLRFLAFLLQRIDGLNVGLVVGSRWTDAAVSDEAREVLDAILGHPLLDLLHPAALDADAIAQLVRERLGAPDPPFAAAVRDAVGGNPFLATELIVELGRRAVGPTADAVPLIRELGPPALRRSLLARLRVLPAPALATARAIAVLGDGADAALVAELAGATPQAVAAARDALVAEDILAPHTFAFVHPLVRRAVESDLGEREQAQGHRTAAERLLAAGAAPSRVAAHLLLVPGRGSEEVVALLREAAAAVEQRGAPELAARYLRRALREPPTPDVEPQVLLALGRAELRAAETASSISTLTRALEGDPGSVGGELALEYANAMLHTADGARAVGPLRRALDGGGALDPLLRSRLEGVLTLAAYSDLEAFTALGRLPAALPRPDGAADDLAGRLELAASALVHAFHGDAPTAERYATLAAGGERLLDDLGPGEPSFYLAASALVWADALPEALRVLTAAIDAARRTGSAAGFMLASHFRAGAWLRRGALVEVEADARNALELGAPYGTLVGAVFLAEALVERGDPDGADEILSRAWPDRRAEPPGGIFAVMSLEVAGRIRLAQDRAAEGVAALRRAGELERRWALAAPALSQWRAVLARQLAAEGRSGEAAELAREAVAIAETHGSRRALGIALHARAVADPEAPREGLLRDAAALLDGAGARLEQARALADLGVLLRAERRADDAAATLRDAAALAAACGAHPLERRIAQELTSAGAAPRPRGPHLRDELTAAETRVARMAADGLTNRQIAQALFLTQKTIETHLSSAYRKLGIRSRVQLADALPGAPADGLGTPRGTTARS